MSPLVHKRGYSGHVGEGNGGRWSRPVSSCGCCCICSVPLVSLIRRGRGGALQREACRTGGVAQLPRIGLGSCGGASLLPSLQGPGCCAVSPEGPSFSGELRGPLRVLCWSSRRRRVVALSSGQLSFAHELTVPQKAGHAVGRWRDRVASFLGVHLYL